MGKKKGQTERTRVSAHEDRLKLNGVAWAAKLGIPTDEEFWAKWATLDDATNCDGVCDRRAQKIIANFGFSREHNTGTTDGACSSARARGAAGGGKRGAGGSKTGIDDARSAPDERCRRLAEGGGDGDAPRRPAPARARRQRGVGRGRGAARAPVGSATWAAAPRPVAPRPPPPPAAPRMRPEGAIRTVVGDRYGFIHADDEKIGRDLFFLCMQGLAVHPELADSREDDELARALALSREQAAPPVSPVREDDDDDLAWALELSRASEPGSFDAGGADVWERVVDAQSGAPYWWNRDTDETTWDDPAAGRDGGGLSAALDGSAAAPFDTLEGMLRAVGLSDLAPALAAEEVDLETLKFLCLDDLVSDLGIPEAQAAALLAARDARERGQAGLA
ncbi:E3 ubiquitin protein ligase [Aureococcus anophagefferens]|uniref:E3 ubiquitin protein ligase n=1 Tax=Aureococcus anophagefferens TaxID=44056 RepID=A0ABR1GG42_AURAN